MAEILDKESLRALSAETRQQIIKMLSQRPYTASELSKLLGKHVTTITEHLAMLEQSKLVEKKDDGHKWLYYSLTAKGEKLTKPLFYSWTVMLVLSAVAFVGGFYNLFSSSASQIAPAAQELYKVADAVQYTPEISSGMWLIIAAILLLIAAIILYKKEK